MARLKLLSLLFLSLILSGCVIKNASHTVWGDYYLSSKKYDRGLERFAVEAEESPDSATAHYYYGRFLLIEGEYPQASQHLTQAAEIEADNPEYQFWAGVASGALGELENEEASYRRALALDDDHLPSLIYLGHVEFRKKKYEEAMALYDRSLKIWSTSPESLYNRALIFHIRGQRTEELSGWQTYLSSHTSGSHARMATEYLNLLKDFSFRNHRIGLRTVTIKKIPFKPGSGKIESPGFSSLDRIGEIFENLKRGKLQIVVYQKDNSQLARERALTIRRYLIDKFSGIDSETIGVSWFPEPQKIEVKGAELIIDDSVSFFVTEL